LNNKTLRQISIFGTFLATIVRV